MSKPCVCLLHYQGWIDEVREDKCKRQELFEQLQKLLSPIEELKV